MSYRLDHIALLVRDLDKSIAFLTGVLARMEIANPMGGTTIRWIEIGEGTHSILLEKNRLQSFQAAEHFLREDFSPETA